MHYYLLRHGVKAGPYSEERLYAKYAEGKIPADTLCCPRRTYRENPDAPWTPLFKILRSIYPGRRNNVAEARLTRQEIEKSNASAGIVAAVGLVACIGFLLASLPEPDPKPGAIRTTPTANAAHEIKYQTAFQVAGAIAGALLATGGLLSFLPRRDP